jgi:putative membrane protein
MAEANLGQLAQEKASSQHVKDFAQEMVTDHTADYTKISGVASKAGLTVPKALDAQHIRMSAPLRKASGAAFDKQYARMMVSGHESAIAAYNKEAREGKNADLKAYAQATLPTLEKHKSGAQDLLGAKK